MNSLTDIFKQLFTPEQQTALLIITLGVMALTQVFKNVYFGFYPKHTKNVRKAVLWLAAFCFGVVGGVAGYYVGQPPQPLWFWMFTGAASGCVAVGAFKLFIEIDWRGMIRDAVSRKS